MYTPALTMVAAWIRALTGVGPSMASGSHTCSGNWALLPTAPVKSSRQIHVQRAGADLASRRLPRTRSVNCSVPKVRKMSSMPSVKPKSPTRLTRNAFLPACEALLLAEPEGDEQVGAQAHALPAEEHEQVVVRQDEDEHGEHEEVEVGEEPVVALVVLHVADRVVVHEHADRAHDEQHDRRERVDQVAPA